MFYSLQGYFRRLVPPPFRTDIGQLVKWSPATFKKRKIKHFSGLLTLPERLQCCQVRDLWCDGWDCDCLVISRGLWIELRGWQLSRLTDRMCSHMFRAGVDTGKLIIISITHHFSFWEWTSSFNKWRQNLRIPIYPREMFAVSLCRRTFSCEPHLLLLNFNLLLKLVKLSR